VYTSENRQDIASKTMDCVAANQTQCTGRLRTLLRKVSGLPVPCRDVTYQTLWPGIVKILKESLVSDIPAGGGKTTNLFYSVGASLFLNRLDKYPLCWDTSVETGLSLLGSSKNLVSINPTVVNYHQP
jgi:hypothetical protein